MATLTAQQIKDVLTYVKDRPGFRNDLLNDPAGTLANVGISFDATDIPQPPEKVILPTDDAIRDRLDALTQQVVEGFGLVRHLLQLDAD